MRSLALSLGILLVSSCGTLPVDRAVNDDAWRLTGKLSVNSPERARVMNIDWVQRPNLSDVTLSAPFGMKTVRILADADALTVDTGEAVTRYKAGEAVHVGGNAFLLPWWSLARWVRGRSLNGVSIGRRGVREGPWRIVVLDASQEGPRLMEFRHPKVTLRLSVRQWTFEAPGAVSR